MGGGIGRGDRGHHHLGGEPPLAQAQRLLQGNLVEGIRRELDALGDHPGAVGLDLDPDVVIDDAFVGDQDLHESATPERTFGNDAAAAGR